MRSNRKPAPPVAGRAGFSQPGSSRIAISIGRITDRREHYHNPYVTAAELTEPVIHID